MPRDSLSEHFPLGAKLGQFLDMPITRQEIDNFVVAPCPDHWRERGTVYRVSNVFAVPMGTSTRGHHHHALCGSKLAAGGDTALLMSTKVQIADVIDNAALCVALGERDMSTRSAEAVRRETGRDPKGTWRVWAPAHNAEVRAVCGSLKRYWAHELDVYEESIVPIHLKTPTTLRLVSYFRFAPPRDGASRWTNVALQGEYAAAYETRHLIVLTAHQELTALYAWLVEWYEAALAGSLHADGEGLDDDRLALLSIRARGVRYWTRGRTTADNDVHARRRDAPIEDLTPYCYLSSLYWDFYQLYSEVYKEVVRPARCAGSLADGSPCPYALPLVDGPGPKPTYCQRCSGTRKREQNAARQRRYREKPSTETEGVTPNNA